MIKSRKVVVAVVLALIIVLVFTIYVRNQEGAQQLVDRGKFSYAFALSFRFRIVIHDQTFRSNLVVAERILAGSYNFDPFYTDLVFVHSQADAEGFPDNIVVAWPTVRGGQAVVRLLQGAVDMTENERNEMRFPRPAVTLEQFGLTQPLTVEDLVDNWEKVNALFRALTPTEQSRIMDVALWHRGSDAEGIGID